MLVIWNERARPFRDRAGAGSAVMFSPAKHTSPRSERSSPASWPMSVVFPAPFGPMIACVSPSRTSRSMPSLARSAPKLFLRPRTSRRLLILVEQPRESSPEEQHRKHQQRPENNLPVLRPAREQVLEDEERERAEHRPGDAPHATEDHHEHQLARASPVHELRREVRGVVDEQRTGEAAYRTGDHESREAVPIGRNADGARARLVGPRGADHHAKARIYEAVPEEEHQDENGEHQIVEHAGVVQIDSREPALR